VALADSGARALQIVDAGEIDLVLLDSMMPGMTGLEVLKLLRATRSPAELPVIMVTAVCESQKIAEALDSGANDYVTKPVDYTVALARIRSQLSRAKIEKAVRQAKSVTRWRPRGATTDCGLGLARRQDRLLDAVEGDARARRRGGSDSPDEWLSRIHPADKEGFTGALEANWKEAGGPV